MFTPNGQLFVDNTSGILKFKIDKMQFTGNTLREALNHYRNYKHLPELTGRLSGKVYLETLAGLPQQPLTPHPPPGKKPSTLRKTYRPPPPIPTRRRTPPPPPPDTINLSTIVGINEPNAQQLAKEPPRDNPSRQELYPISPGNPAPASTLPAAVSLQPLANAILKGLPQDMPTRLPITVSGQTPATTYAKGRTMPGYMRPTLSKTARNAATLRKHNGSMAKTQKLRP